MILMGYSLSAGYLPQLLNHLSDKVDKGIMIAGSPRSLMELMEEQLIYLLDYDMGPHFNANYEVMLDSLSVLKEKAANKTAKDDDIYLNVAYKYWKSDAEYDAQAAFKKVKQPLLILQGGKDYQVTVKDYNNWMDWKKKYNKKNVDGVLLPEMNHIMNISTDERSSPNEYYKDAEFEVELIQEIKKWILK